MHRPTVYDVARQAGVGVGTVSRVLNGDARAHPRTQERVLRAIEELGFYPDERARALRRQRGGFLCVVTPFFTKNLYLEILRAIERVSPPEYILTVMNVESPEEKERCFSLVARDSRLGGIIVVNLTPPEWLGTRYGVGLPIVLADVFDERFSAVGFDHRLGGYLGTRHLLDLGHRRIGYIGRPQDPFTSRGSGPRAEGYQHALQEAGIGWREEYFRPGEYSREDGMIQAMALLDVPEPPTAIFASSDLQAVGVLEAAQQRGLRVPQDLAVLGYHDVELAQHLGLSTVRLPIPELAEQVLALLRGSWNGEQPQQLSLLAPTLIVRQTCGGS